MLCYTNVCEPMISSTTIESDISRPVTGPHPPLFVTGKESLGARCARNHMLIGAVIVI